MNRLFPLIFFVVITTALAYSRAFAGNIDADTDGYKYAWGENTGFISFDPSEGPGVTVTDSAVTGYAWAENTGWVNLSPSAYEGVTNNGSGKLSGYAWSENVGWISFSCENNAGCATVDYGVSIDPSTGEFSGTAWAENAGWINFTCSGSDDFCVKTSWRQDVDPTSDTGGGGSSGLCFISTANAKPNR